MKNIKPHHLLISLVSLFPFYKIIANESKSFEATRSYSAPQPTESDPLPPTTTTWTDKQGNSISNTREDHPYESYPSSTTYSVDGTTEDSSSASVTYTQGSDEQTFTGSTSLDGNTYDYSGNATFSEPSTGVEQKELSITGDNNSSNTLNYTEDLGSSTTSSGSSETGGSESGSSTITSDDTDRKGEVDITPGTRSQYYGNEFDVDYSESGGTLQGSITEESD